jgi:inner membrane protein
MHDSLHPGSQDAVGVMTIDPFYSLADGGRPVRFDAFERGSALMVEQAHHPQLQRMQRFADGFISLRQNAAGDLVMSAWGMGKYPNFVFTFNIGPALEIGVAPPVAIQERRAIDLPTGLAWLWTRMWGQDTSPPR